MLQISYSVLYYGPSIQMLFNLIDMKQLGDITLGHCLKNQRRFSMPEVKRDGRNRGWKYRFG
jgi:hypothetical protein